MEVIPAERGACVETENAGYIPDKQWLSRPIVKAINPVVVRIFSPIHRVFDALYLLKRFVKIIPK
jgi:hypothetical protein